MGDGMIGGCEAIRVARKGGEPFHNSAIFDSAIGLAKRKEIRGEYFIARSGIAMEAFDHFLLEGFVQSAEVNSAVVDEGLPCLFDGFEREWLIV